MMMMMMIENDDGVWLCWVLHHTHTKKKEFFFLLFFVFSFLIFLNFRQKKGLFKAKRMVLGSIPNGGIVQNTLTTFNVFDRASIALTFRRRVGASIAQ